MSRVIKKEIKTRKLENFYLKKSEKTKYGGAGEGGVYRDKSSGKDYLIKRVALPGITDPTYRKKSNWRTWDEILAARLLKAAGVLVPNMFAVEDEHGVVYVASAMLSGVNNCNKDKFQTLPLASKELVFASQLLHCWLGNRDLVNAKGENFVVDADSRVFNVDLGAALFSGFRRIIEGQDDINFNESNIEPFLLERENKEFGVLKNRKNEKVSAFNINSTTAFFATLTASKENERKYQLQGALMIAQFSDQDIEDLVNSTGHTKEDKERRIAVLKARKATILDHIQKKYGEHALKEEQIALALQHIFHKFGLYNKNVEIGMGSDAIVSYQAQYTNAVKPNVKINSDGTVIIQLQDKQHHAKALLIIQRLAGMKTMDNKQSITVTPPIDNFTKEIHKELVENSLQVFFSSFGYLSDVNDEFHHYAYKGDGSKGFRPTVTTQDNAIVITLPPNAHEDGQQAILKDFSAQFDLEPFAIHLDKNALHITGITLEQLAHYFMQNKGVRKTAVISENKEGKILAGKLDPQKKGVSGFATAGGGSDHPYNPIRAAREEGTDEFGHSININAPLIPIGSTLPNKKKNIFLVQPGGTASKADIHIGYKEFQDNSIRYYSFSEFREAYKNDKVKFDRSSVDLYLRFYQREIQKALSQLGVNNILVQISKKPETLGKISLKPTIENYDYSSAQLRVVDAQCINLITKLVGAEQFKRLKKYSQQGDSKKGMTVVREYILLSDNMNPAIFHSLLLNEIQGTMADVNETHGIDAEVNATETHKMDTEVSTKETHEMGTEVCTKRTHEMGIEIDAKKTQKVGTEANNSVEYSKHKQLDSLRQTLISKVDNYLHWRNHKDIDEGRGYKLGLFTKLRHYSQFGQNRAENLKKELIATDPNGLFSILKKHFSNHSTLHNHSLDTYLLEGVMKHHQLLNLNNDIDLHISDDRVKLREIIKDCDFTEVSEINQVALIK
ncbi:hypothetical protein [Legionella brunensis]|uniref:Uncharacterized protein n=1 Tax=Legionella brunensis TaxID=29422 RepID=A0A0W0SP34_9GAMM|nr:hypothetical protein [Legionella brunensis]KTC85020.1 hypothetical protein Lbru_1235 [Legionella brunensis]